MNAVKLFIGIIFNAQVNLLDIYSMIEECYGDIESQSEIFDFDHTIYYKAEMGQGLKKQFVSIKPLVDPVTAYQTKIKSVEIEKKCMIKNQRAVNLDPGILSAHNVILYSTKNYSHRIPLSNNIYAELTYIYKKNSYEVVPWSYPDFKKKAYLDFFKSVRKTYLNYL